MYGLMIRMISQPGKRDELLGLMVPNMADMSGSGCFNHVIGKDSADENGIWIAEYWDSKENHDEALKTPELQAVMKSYRHLVAGFDSKSESVPVAGTGIG